MSAIDTILAELYEPTGPCGPCNATGTLPNMRPNRSMRDAPPIADGTVQCWHCQGRTTVGGELSDAGRALLAILAEHLREPLGQHFAQRYHTHEE